MERLQDYRNKNISCHDLKETFSGTTTYDVEKNLRLFDESNSRLAAVS